MGKYDYGSMYPEHSVVLGLDYGTFNSYVAYKAADEPIPRIVDVNGSRSVFWTDGQKEYFCDDVIKRDLPVSDPDRVVSSPKLLINKPETVTIDGQRCSVEAINRGIIQSVLAQALKTIEDDYLEKPERRVVLCAPVTFGSEEKRLLRKAVTDLGFQCSIINEPTAAAVYLESALGIKLEHFLVLDFGAGTFDAAMMSRNPDVMDPEPFVVCYQNGNRIAGDVCDEIMAELLLKKIRSVLGSVDFRRVSDKNSGAYRRLLDQARRCKHALSDSESVSFHLNAGEDGISAVTVTRNEFESQIRSEVVEPALRIAGKVVERSNMKDRRFQVLLVGGSARIPLIAKMTEEYFYWLSPEDILMYQPEHAVAYGAALYCERPSFKPKIMYGYAVRSLNQKHQEGLDVCIPSDAPLPYVITTEYAAKEAQREMVFQFFQLEDCGVGDFLPTNRHKHAVIELRHDFQRVVPQGTKVKLRVELEKDGILRITVLDEFVTGTVTSAEVDTKTRS